MNTYAGRRRSFLLVALLLLISISLEQYFIAGLFPWVGGLGGIRPMVVFLDIPVYFPVTIDLIPVGLLFSFFYSIVLLPGLPRMGGPVWPVLQKKVGGALLGLSFLLICLLAGGVIFYLLRDYLPREVRNGIDSFGIQADLSLPYPGEGTIHLRGSMILLAAFYAGMRIWMRNTGKAAVIMPADAGARAANVARTEDLLRTAAVVKATNVARAGKKISMQVPEPVMVEERIGRGRMNPCVVDTEMVPRAERK
jgi:hypothetical protein